MFMNFPKKGKTYTIRGFCFLGISMHLEEIKNQPLPGRDEIWFYNWHFRKRIILHKEEVEQSKKKAKNEAALVTGADDEDEEEKVINLEECDDASDSQEEED